MLEKITADLEAFKAIHVGATKIWNDTRKEIDANYRGNLQATKMTAAKETYENTLAQARDKYWADITEELNTIREQVRTIVTRPVEPDFPATLETLRAIKHPTPVEIEGIVERYRNNYLSWRAICDVMAETHKTSFRVIRADRVVESVARLEVELHECIFGMNPDTYIYRLMLQGEYMGNYDDMFTEFIAGRYEEALKAAERSEVSPEEYTVDVTQQTKNSRKPVEVQRKRKPEQDDEQD